MKISEILKQGKPTLSFEVFPPKTQDAYSSVEHAVEEICALSPDFMSVTFGAAGTTSEYSLSIAKDVLQKGVTPLAHLTCVNSSEEKIDGLLRGMKENGIENIMALRGDIPSEGERVPRAFLHASDLVRKIKQTGDFCVGGACYPEGHVECASRAEDIANLKIKVEAGVDFLTTQMFFDNHVLYNFLYQIREAGITVPVVAGIMPVTNAKQIARICSLSGTYLPERFKRIVDRFGDRLEAMAQAGIVYAAEQIIDLYANGVNAVHVYSMNKPYIAAALQTALGAIIGK
ncbi:MAG: methylenetetrahydrofolate reductase [Clostridia bacterium]|nr:methylenetetrahydrofolate reductase [Clostridia bacterium]